MKLTIVPCELDEANATSYWVALRAYKLSLQRRCELCTVNRKDLNVHHETYRHRGSEWRHLDDLAVLCEPCHKSVHDAANVRKQLPA